MSEKTRYRGLYVREIRFAGMPTGVYFTVVCLDCEAAWTAAIDSPLPKCACWEQK